MIGSVISASVIIRSDIIFIKPPTMEVSQEFAFDLRLKSNRLYQPEQPARRPLSPQEEKIQLLRKIEAVSASNR